MVGLVGLALVVGAGALVLTGGGPQPDPRDGSEDLGPGDPIAIEHTPVAYRIVYRLEEHGAAGTTVSTERVAVRRPFDSRTEVWEGPPPGLRLGQTRVSTFARLALRGEAPEAPGAPEAPEALVLPPEPAFDDLRIGPVLDAALAADQIERRELRRIGDRVCQVYRSGAPLSGALVAGTEDDHVDTCVDAAGLVLEQVEVATGRTVARRLAVEVEEDADLGDELFAVTNPEVPVEQGGGSVLAVDPESRPEGEFWHLPSAGSGFEHQGRYSVIPPQAENFTDPERIGHRLALVADVWVRGPDVLIVEQGGTLHGFAPFAPNPAHRAVDLGELGTGGLALDGRASQISVLRGGGRFVRVTGTLAPDVLVTIARALERVEGNGLVSLE